MTEQRKISELTEVTTLSGDDELVFVHYGSGPVGPEPDDYIQLEYRETNEVILPRLGNNGFTIDWDGEEEVVQSGLFGVGERTKTWTGDPVTRTITITGNVSTFGGDTPSTNLYNVSNKNLIGATIKGMSSIIDSSWAFYEASNLVNVDVSEFDTGNVTKMNVMFGGCSSLESLDLSNLNTSKVTNMYGMMERCSSLESLDVTSMDTSKVTEMMTMFQFCSSLTSLNLSNFNTSNVLNMKQMFSGCTNLTTLEGVADFDTSNISWSNDTFWAHGLAYMFTGCTSLVNLDLSNWCVSQYEYPPQLQYFGQDAPFHATESNRPQWGVECTFPSQTPEWTESDICDNIEVAGLTSTLARFNGTYDYYPHSTLTGRPFWVKNGIYNSDGTLDWAATQNASLQAGSSSTIGFIYWIESTTGDSWWTIWSAHIGSAELSPSSSSHCSPCTSTSSNHSMKLPYDDDGPGGFGSGVTLTSSNCQPPSVYCVSEPNPVRDWFAGTYNLVPGELFNEKPYWYREDGMVHIYWDYTPDPAGSQWPPYTWKLASTLGGTGSRFVGQLGLAPEDQGWPHEADPRHLSDNAQVIEGEC